MAVFRIDRFGPSKAAASAVRERLSGILKPAGRRRAADPRMIRLVEYSLVVAIGALLGWIFWIGLGPISPPPAAPAPIAAPAETANAGPIDPFRTAGAPVAAAVVETGADFAETTLNLTLHGTWVDDKGGTAIIRTPDDKQGRFAAGDTITGGVTLERVMRDQVVIIRNGVRESLRLINREIPAAAEQQAAPSAAASAVDGMASIGQFVIATPQIDAIGGVALVLQPADDPEGFEALGLEPGDTLVAVDNQPIDRDIAKGLETLATIENKESVTLSIERDGVVMPITIALPKAAPTPDE